MSSEKEYQEEDLGSMLLCSGLLKLVAISESAIYEGVHCFQFSLIYWHCTLINNFVSKYWLNKVYHRSYRKRTVRTMMKFCFLQGISEILKHLFLIFLQLRVEAL